MADIDPPGQADDFYVPSPEELEQGLEAPSRRRRGDRRQPDRRRGVSRSSWARRLFRLQPGVGQKRTEAPAPAPTPPRVDSPPAAPRTEPDPPIRIEPTRSSRLSSSKPPKPQASRTQPPRPVSRQPVKDGKPSPSASSGRRVRRVAVPKPEKRPSREERARPFDDYVLDRAKSLGHEFGQFTRTYSRSSAELYEGNCLKCGSKAIARHSAPENWTLKDAGVWDLKGAPADSVCTGNDDVGDR